METKTTKTGDETMTRQEIQTAAADAKTSPYLNSRERAETLSELRVEWNKLNQARREQEDLAGFAS